MIENNNVIYILTNPSFPEYVKIGYADDIKKRLQQLNRSECTPFGFRLYATYKVNTRLSDIKLHEIIDKLNPDLRAIDNINGKKRVREFYAMTAEDAYSLFEAMAEIHGTQNNLQLYSPTKFEQAEIIAAKEIKDNLQKSKPFRFSLCNIPIGAKITFCKDESIYCTVIDDKKVKYNNEVMSLTALAKILLNLGKDGHVSGPKYFKYNGQYLNDLRKDEEEI